MGTLKRTRSEELFSKAEKLFPGGVNSPVRAFGAVGGKPFVVKEGRGAYLYDLDGNKYVDFVCSWGPLVLGHAHPKVVEAIARQAEKGTSYGACCELEVELGSLIKSLMPNLEMLRFVNSGTEAAMAAIRLARGYTGRNKIIKFSGCYHGHSDPLLVKAGSGVLTLSLPDSVGVPAQAVSDTLSVEFNDHSAVEELFNRYPQEIAAVIVEPVVGNSGLIAPQSEFLTALRNITSKYNALLIFDEVMTGFRVHMGGAQALYNVKPDLTLLGKVIGGGLPVGAFGGRKEIMSMLAPLGAVYQAGTLSGNPLAMCAGIATLQEWSRAGVFEEVATSAKTVVQAFSELGESAGISICAESVGTMFGFFFQPGPVKSYSDAKRSDISRFSKFFRAMLEQGVYFAPSQFEAGFVSSAHKGEPIEQTISALSKVMSTL